MQANKNKPRSDLWIDLSYAFVLGLAFMQLVVGLDKINPSFTSWLLIRGSDLSYHYLSWEYFKDTPWMWPPGRLEGYAYPMYNSVMYTDSIPLFAFIFKSIRFFLPNDFQYFGLWYASCFILNAYFGLEILKHIGWDRAYRWLIAPFFVGAVVLIARFGHAALCGQWVLLYVFLIYLKKNQWTWTMTRTHLMSVVLLVSLIHPYLVFMVLGLAVSIPLRLRLDRIISTKTFWLTIVQFIVLTFIGWYLSGAFLFKGQLSEGLGKFSANLNTLVNAWDVGRWGPSFPYYGDGQGEGIAYLGLGFLVLAGLVLVYLLIKRLRNPMPEQGRVAAPWNTLFIICLLFFIYAWSPKWALGSRLLIDWGYNDYISRTFRGTGRFAWPLFYFIMYDVFRRLYHLNINQGLKYVLVISGLAIQAGDLSPLWKRKAYIDDPPFRMAYIDQFSYLISKCDKVIVYPPYSISLADWWDFIYFIDLAQQAKKSISTGYGARFPQAIGKAFRDSLNDLPGYLQNHPNDLIISFVDSVDLHQRLIRDAPGVSFHFDRYRVFITDSMKSRLDLSRFDPKSLEGIQKHNQISLEDFIRSNINHTILGTVYEEGVSNLKNATKDYLKQLGSNTDSLKYGTSWAFIIKGHKIIKESISINQKVILDDTLRCSDSRIPIHLESGGYQVGKSGSVTVGHQELLKPDRGLSLIVLDSCGSILDKVRFDTYLSDGYLER